MFTTAPPYLRDLRSRLADRRASARRATAPAALVLVVLLTGCAGIVAGLPGTAPPPYTETGAALNGTDLRGAHLASLEDAGSFGSASTLVLEGEEHAFAVNRSAAVDARANRSLATVRVDSDAVDGEGLAVARYTNGSTTYRRVAIEGDQSSITRFDAATEPYDDGLLAVRPVDGAEAAHADLVERVVDDVEWTMVGVERYDGGWVTRYEASGPENVSALDSTAMVEAEGDATDGTGLPETFDLDVRSVNATLLVSPDGIVRRFSVHAVGNAAGHPAGLTLTFETDDVGSTTVEAPSWVAEAVERTGA